MATYTDTHAHIYSEEFEHDRLDMLARARDAGVDRIYMPNVDHTSIDGMLDVESRNPGMCFAMIGLHPCSVKKDFEKELYLVEHWLASRRFSALGEMGTDLYWDKTFWDQQREAFLIQTRWAKKYRLPLVIHCRESMDETIALLEPQADGKLTGIFHCFSGTVEQADRIISLGFYLGIGGVATFKNGGLDGVLPKISLEKIVLETDSPYLAPVPFRGKRNEPHHIPLIANRLATLMNVPVAQIQETTSGNAKKIFGIDLT